MGNYDYMKNSNRKGQYPLKIYLSKEDTVVVMYTKAVYSDTFSIQNTCCILNKTYFYKFIDKLNKSKTATLQDGQTTIKVDIFQESCRVQLTHGVYTSQSEEKDQVFRDWILSIDLRKSKRIKTLIPISVESDSVFGYGAILDLSSTGFKIGLNDELNIEEELILSIFDPEFPAGNIRCKIKRESQQNDKFIYGLEILEMSAETKLGIDNILLRAQSPESHL